MSLISNAPTIIVTRPIAQAQHLIEQLQVALTASASELAQQTKVLALPLLKIVPKTDYQLQVEIPAAISQADLVIFVSPNAIEYGMRLLSAPWHELTPMQIRVGVMGESSKEHSYIMGLKPILLSCHAMFSNGIQKDSGRLYKKSSKNTIGIGLSAA